MAKQKREKKKTSMLATVAIGAGAAAIGAGAYIYFTRKQEDSLWNRYLVAMGKDPLPTDAVVVTDRTPTTMPSGTQNANITDYRTLYSRSPRDLYTEALQKFLNEKSNAGLVVDAQYGGKTAAAATAYMTKEKIDGAELAKQVAIWDGKVSSTTAVATTTAFSFPTDYKDAKRYDSVRALQVALNNRGFTDYENKKLVEDGIIGYRTGSAMVKAGFTPFETTRISLLTFANVSKLPISAESYNKFMGSSLGRIEPNDVIVIGKNAIIYDLNNQPQKHYVQNEQGQYEQRVFANIGQKLGKVQGADELSYLFITADGNLRKVRKSVAALALAE